MTAGVCMAREAGISSFTEVKIAFIIARKEIM